MGSAAGRADRDIANLTPTSNGWPEINSRNSLRHHTQRAPNDEGPTAYRRPTSHQMQALAGGRDVEMFMSAGSRISGFRKPKAF